MENYKNFELKSEYFGKIKFETENFGFNTIIISAVCVGNVKDYQRIGRLVQVRKRQGEFGSDVILLRLMDGSLMSFANQVFYSINEEYKEYIHSLFNDVYLDEYDIEYSIQGREKATGFIVEDIQYKIYQRKNKLDSLNK